MHEYNILFLQSWLVTLLVHFIRHYPEYIKFSFVHSWLIQKYEYNFSLVDEIGGSMLDLIS